MTVSQLVYLSSGDYYRQTLVWISAISSPLVGKGNSELEYIFSGT